MVKKAFVVAAVVLLSSSLSCAESLFDVIAGGVKATASGVNKVVSNANPAKIISDTTDGTVEAGQKAGEAAIGGAANTVGVVSQATGN
jgi:hypothetical protein